MDVFVGINSSQMVGNFIKNWWKLQLLPME